LARSLQSAAATTHLEINTNAITPTGKRLRVPLGALQMRSFRLLPRLASK